MAITPRKTYTYSDIENTTEQALVPTLAWSQMSETDHFVQFYETDDFLLDSLSGYIGKGFAAGDACIVVATQAHRDGLEKRLQAQGFDAQQDGYIPLDALATLSQFMVDGMPEPERFAEVIGSLIVRASGGRRRVRIFGEMVALLWIEGNQPAAIRLEELWNDLQTTTCHFALFCAYPTHSFTGEEHRARFAEVCQRHSQVIPDESYSALLSSEERLRAITLLQQKANSLEAEVAERKAAEERLREMERRKDEFICMASHELKTPVTSLKGFLALLQHRLSATGDESTLRYIDRLNTQVNKLTKLINDLLDISKMETGNLDYRLERFGIDALVLEIVENVQEAAQKHRLLLDGHTGAEVCADRDRIGQVLINLLNNAVKYSPRADTVLVHIAQNRGQVVISVQDFGIGIAKEHQQKIFERFYQVTDAEVKTYPGLGIGLYISCEIIKRHNGHLWVESEKGQGSTFHFALPLY